MGRIGISVTSCPRVIRTASPGRPDASGPRAAGGWRPPGSTRSCTTEGGEVVVHSSVQASHGSSPAGWPFHNDTTRLYHENGEARHLEERPERRELVPERPAPVRRRRCRSAGACPASPRRASDRTSAMKADVQAARTASAPAARRASGRSPWDTSSGCPAKVPNSVPPIRTQWKWPTTK